MYCSCIYKSPVGPLTLIEEDGALTGLTFGTAPLSGCSDNSPLLAQARLQLDEYFSGSRTSFTVPLRLKGTAFQQQVWQALLQIPFGETASYGDIARSIGNPKAVRAVGMANNRNPVSILVPCHRVIGKNGSLVGYGGGLHIKQWLLEHEKLRKDY